MTQQFLYFREWSYLTLPQYTWCLMVFNCRKFRHDIQSETSLQNEYGEKSFSNFQFFLHCGQTYI